MSNGAAGRFFPEGLLCALCLALLTGCGQLPPLPAQLELETYTPITYEQLLAPRQAQLQAGQKIKVTAYFWQFLSYDPDMVRNYPNLLHHPVAWYKLQWYALYGQPDMKGYFDLGAMAPEQREAYRLRRLQPIAIYGELASMGPGLLYLRTHHVEKLEMD